MNSELKVTASVAGLFAGRMYQVEVPSKGRWGCVRALRQNLEGSLVLLLLCPVAWPEEAGEGDGKLCRSVLRGAAAFVSQRID